MNQKVSVIVPIYNAGRFLCQTIDSILNQTYRDIELILVDDCSSDFSPEICKEYLERDNRVVYRRLSVQGGVSNARNTGIELAHGKWIFFSDHDDYLFPDMIETCVNTIGERDFLVTGIFGAPEHEFSKDLQRKTILKPTFVADCIEDMVGEKYDNIVKWIGGIWRCLFSKAVLEKYSIRFRTIQGEDEIFLAEYSQCIESAIRIDDYQGYCWIKRKGSQGSSHKYIVEQNWIDLRKQIYDKTKHKFRHEFEWSYMDILNRYVHYILKGYYLDTRVPRAERMKRWRSFRSDSWWPKMSKMHIRDKRCKLMMLLAKYRLHGLADVCFCLMSRMI